MKDRRIRIAQALMIAVILLAVLGANLLGGERTTGAGKNAQYAVPADLNGQPLAVVTGSAYADFASELYPDSKLLHVNDWADTFMLVTQGKAEGLLMEDTDIDIVYEAYPDLIALPGPIRSVEYSFLMSNTDAGRALAKEFNTFLAEYKERGDYIALQDKWLKQEQGAGDPVLEPCASDGSKGTLRVTSCNDWFGYCYVANGKDIGLFLDITYRFCEWAGYTPILDIVHFSAGIMGVTSGRYDMLAYGYVYAPERSDELVFTDPLEGADIVAIVRKDSVADGESVSAGEKLGFFEGVAQSFEKNFVREKRWVAMLSGLGITLMLCVCAAVLGTILGAVICFMRRSENPFLTGFARMYIKLFQGLPIVVLLLVMYYVVFGKSSISAFVVCALGFSLDFSAYTAEIFRSGIDAVPPGQLRAANALGFGKAAAFMNVILPQALRHILPVYRGQFISMVKTTAVAGYISVEDLTKVSDIIRSRTYEAFFPLISTAVIYFTLAALLISALKLIEVRTDPDKRDRRPKGVSL